MFSNQKGFTLIEIITVLIILGVLAAVVIPKYIDSTETAEIKSLDVAMNDLKTRAKNSFAMSVMNNDGKGVLTEYDSFQELGLEDISAITNSYKDFAAGPSGWAFPDDQHIEYQLANGSKDTWVFTLTVIDNTMPPEITLSKK